MTSTVPYDISEYPDPPNVLSDKIDKLVHLIQKSNYMIAFTGAGISTSAGIPDFRGPNGVWTCQAQNRPVPDRNYGSHVKPTSAHMALAALQNCGKLKFLISQNTDGLHLRSGIEKEKIAELHGNSNIEKCSICGERYYRSFRTREARNVRDHDTGRKCDMCGGMLRDTIVNFGETLPQDAVQKSIQHASAADLCLVLGSSCRVSPAVDFPILVSRRGNPVVIINLQKTPIDDLPNVLRIGATIDNVVSAVMHRLGIPIPHTQDLLNDLEMQDLEARIEKVKSGRGRVKTVENEAGLVRVSKHQLMGMSVRELQKMLKDRGISVEGLTGKKELVDKILECCSTVVGYREE
ncbi:DHS-like NAD/FAD-binding domain-containing protein [Paraphysoderma sedebokerense]|nr:DHS-like NAD/FAD-binding domain-containing protein [Paraphysoderma sedebokerense]